MASVCFYGHTDHNGHRDKANNGKSAAPGVLFVKINEVVSEKVIGKPPA